MQTKKPNLHLIASLVNEDDDEANMGINLPDEEDLYSSLNFHVDDYDPYIDEELAEREQQEEDENM